MRTAPPCFSSPCRFQEEAPRRPRGREAVGGRAAAEDRPRWIARVPCGHSASSWRVVLLLLCVHACGARAWACALEGVCAWRWAGARFASARTPAKSAPAVCREARALGALSLWRRSVRQPHTPPNLLRDFKRTCPSQPPPRHTHLCAHADYKQQQKQQQDQVDSGSYVNGAWRLRASVLSAYLLCACLSASRPARPHPRDDAACLFERAFVWSLRRAALLP